MKLYTQYMTQNPCYKTKKTIIPKGIMVHSTAAPGVMAAAWLSRWNKPEVEKCVHAFIDDKEAWQYLPWNHRAWHCGTGPKGLSGNSTHISIEMCESRPITDGAYFSAVFNNTVELCALLCDQFNLTEKNIVTHCEGHKQGFASNHADVMHWFPLHGRSMDDFRAAVAQFRKSSQPPITQKGAPEMTKEEAQGLISAARRAECERLAALPPSSWAEESWSAARQAGLLDGSRPQSAVTRQELAAVLMRLPGLAD